MSEVENQGEYVPEAPSAGEQEDPRIPKHRLDEVIDQKRRLEDELRMKTELLQHMTQTAQAQRQTPQSVLPSAEDLGVDNETYKAAQEISRAHVTQASREVFGHLAKMKNEMEEVKFYTAHPNARKYEDKIRAERERHAQQYDQVLPMENAYYGVIGKEAANRGPAKPATNAASATVNNQGQVQAASQHPNQHTEVTQPMPNETGPQQPQTVNTVYHDPIQQAPNPQHSTVATGSAKVAAEPFVVSDGAPELTEIQKMELLLDQQIAQGKKF